MRKSKQTIVHYQNLPNPVLFFCEKPDTYNTENDVFAISWEYMPSHCYIKIVFPLPTHASGVNAWGLAPTFSLWQILSSQLNELNVARFEIWEFIDFVNLYIV